MAEPRDNRLAGAETVERFFRALKYEYLYRQEIGDGATLAAAVDCHQTVYNDVRPHEAIAFRTPLSALAGLRLSHQFESFHPGNCFTFLTRDTRTARNI